MKPPYFRRNRVDLYRMEWTSLLGPRMSRQTLHILFPSKVPAEVTAQTPRHAPALHHTNHTEGESWNHRMADVGKRPLDVIWPNLPAQDHVQMALACQQGGRTQPPGQPEAVPHHPHREKTFLMFRKNLLCFILCLLPLVLSLGTLERAWLCLLCTSLQVFTSIDESLSLLQAEQTALSAFLHRGDAPVQSL